MKIKGKKMIIPIVVLVVALAVGASAVQAVGGKPTAKQVETYPVAVADLQSSINVTGMVESDNSVNVYTSLNYVIKEIPVEVGDTVEEGDLLCQLDTDALEATIRERSAAVGSAQAKANHSVKMAEKELESVKFTEEDYNTQLLSAKDAIKQAEAAVKTAENTVEKAEHSLYIAQKDYENAVYNGITVNNSYGLTEGYVDTEKDQLRMQVTQRQIEVESARLQLDSAKQSLASAESSLLAIEAQVDESRDTTADQVTTARLSANFSDQYIAIEKLRSDLGDATITAPISGTVTAVIAQEGAVANGLLFIIEDTSSLKIQTKIKEYDIGSVKLGMPVSIKADATGDDEFAGSLSKINPTTIKNETGQTVTTNSAEFPAEVKVSGGSKLKIGMNARMSIITEERKGVLTIPSSSITSDEEGNDVIFIMDPQEDGTFLAKKIPVTVGLENDFASEIEAEGLQEGDEVILMPEGLVDGILVAHKTDDAAAGAPAAGAAETADSSEPTSGESADESSEEPAEESSEMDNAMAA